MPNVFESARAMLNKWAGQLSVRNPLLLFAACAGIIGYELHYAIRDLPQTQIYGLVTIGILAVVFITVVRTVGIITEKNPAHLYDDIELLKGTINSKFALPEIVGKLVSEHLRQMENERIRRGDVPQNRETYIALRNRNRLQSITGKG